MGHHQIEAMARTGPYRQVVALLGRSAGAGWRMTVTPGTLAEVAEATLRASVDGLDRAKGDPGLSFCVYLLAATVRAGRVDDFTAALARLGVCDRVATVGLPDAANAGARDPITAWSLVCGFSAAVDAWLGETRGRTDIGEMAQLSAAEALDGLCADPAETLFGTDAATVCTALRAGSTDAGFGRLAHDFFARLTSRYLQYHLSRELSNHVGTGRRFATIEEHNGFLDGLDRHCRASTRPLRTFAGESYGLHGYLDDWTVEKATGFVARALDKIRLALRHQEGHDVGD